jgi:hypothetical protein
MQILMMFVVAVASARADWLLVGRTDEGDAHYVDVDTLKRSGPRRIQIVAKIELVKPSFGMETRSIRTLLEHDCLLRRQRPVQVTYFTGPNLTGSADIGKGPGAWGAIEPGSLGAELSRLICEFR